MSADEQPDWHPKVNPPHHARCPHCGNVTPHKLRHRADYSQVIDWFNEHEPIFDERWYAILECGTCRELSVYEDYWNESDSRWEPALVYPQRLRAPHEVPAEIATAFDEVVAAAQVPPGLAAVGIRRVLEGIAADQGAPRHALAQQISWLAAENKIPQPLADMMNASRILANLGAHFSPVSVTKEDVDTLTQFALTLFEYIYVAPAKLAAFRKSVSRPVSPRAELPPTATVDPHDPRARRHRAELDALIESPPYQRSSPLGLH